MVAHADTESLGNFLLYIHTDYIWGSQISFISLIITVKVLLSKNMMSY
jgi:hypothetical protein